MTARPRLAALIALLSSVLERNIPEDLLITFKREMMSIQARIAQAMRCAVPGLSEPQIAKFALYVHAFVAGLWPATTPNPVLTRVLERPEFAQMRLEFCGGLEHALRLLLVGLLNES